MLQRTRPRQGRAGEFTGIGPSRGPHHQSSLDAHTGSVGGGSGAKVMVTHDVSRETARGSARESVEVGGVSWRPGTQQSLDHVVRFLYARTGLTSRSPEVPPLPSPGHDAHALEITWAVADCMRSAGRCTNTMTSSERLSTEASGSVRGRMAKHLSALRAETRTACSGWRSQAPVRSQSSRQPSKCAQ